MNLLIFKMFFYVLFLNFSNSNLAHSQTHHGTAGANGGGSNYVSDNKLDGVSESDKIIRINKQFDDFLKIINSKIQSCSASKKSDKKIISKDKTIKEVNLYITTLASLEMTLPLPINKSLAECGGDVTPESKEKLNCILDTQTILLLNTIVTSSEGLNPEACVGQHFANSSEFQAAIALYKILIKDK